MKGRRTSKYESLKNIHGSFDKYKNSRVDIEEIYKIIKDNYVEKMKNNELNFILERVYIKIMAGWDSDENTKVIITSISSLVVGIILAIFGQDIKEGKDVTMELVAFVISILLLGATIIFVNRKSFIRDYNKKIYYKICLDILDELQKND